MTEERYLTASIPASAVRPAPPPASSQLDVNVPCSDGSYQRDPRDCTKYMMCVHGQWQEFTCPFTLEWDAVSVAAGAQDHCAVTSPNSLYFFG